jgi:1,4-dihydroxy-2-naphthoate octaprenyltransferase
LAVFLLLPYFLNLLWMGVPGVRWAVWLPFVALPLALCVVAGVARTRSGVRMNLYLALSSLHLLVFALLWMAGMKFGSGGT